MENMFSKCIFVRDRGYDANDARIKTVLMK